ncbi:hypothetical protein E8E12_007140 [Didymella heteroderae]|uniref:Uncharacterized protein n=1 Tax=Didymella heteroderae TaxID=1769908 RepID=A0A9P5BZA4_9PLEO|nr:hypothetical protein E8E12_007140 [Didymella heteroderae]
MWTYFHLSEITIGLSQVNPSSTVDVSRILLDARSLNASEPRDKIFALQGMLKTMGARFVAPDYTTPTEKVYTEATEAAIIHDRTLRILTGITGHRKIDKMPSWVPDYSDSDSITEVDEWEEYQAAGTRSIFPPKVMSTRGELKLEGFAIDRISQLLTAFSIVQDLREPHQLAKELRWPLEQDLLPREEYLDFLRKLALPTWEASKHKWPLASIIRRLLGEVRTAEVSKILAETLHPIRENLIKRFDRKVLCRTHNGRLCLVSIFAKQHDTLALLAGCNLPMVLRAADSDWTLVAPAYIYSTPGSDEARNVMDGSLWTYLHTAETPRQFTVI